MNIITTEQVMSIYGDFGIDISAETSEEIAWIATCRVCGADTVAYDLVYKWAENAEEATREYNGVYTGIVNPFHYCE